MIRKAAKIEISCPGKIILMGEHAVVYGKPAIVAAVDKRIKIILKKRDGNFTILAKSEIPYGVGMGSSAALAVVYAATLLAISRKSFSLSRQNRKLINEIAYQQEKINHGNPSGVDNTIITYGGLLWFRRKKEGAPFFKRIKSISLPPFVLINTGRPHERTLKMVEHVRRQMLNSKTKAGAETTIAQIGKITQDFLRAMKTENETAIIGSIRRCERKLEGLGVVTEFGKRLIREIEKLGGAAKVSGAGGKTGKGCGMILAYHKNPLLIFNLAERYKLSAFKAKLGGEGVKIINK